MKRKCGSRITLCAIVASQSRFAQPHNRVKKMATPCRNADAMASQPTWPARSETLGPWPARPPAQPCPPAHTIVTQTDNQTVRLLGYIVRVPIGAIAPSWSWIAYYGFLSH